MKKINKIVKEVAKKYSDIKSVKGIVLGGSMARGFSGDNSDIEIYVYYRKNIPSKKEIKKILEELDANLTRSQNPHWNHPAWGIHTFFAVSEYKIELGYRDINRTKRRIKKFLKGENILSRHGIHDCPFGHYESGVASCIKECKIIEEKEESITNLKRIVEKYPGKLQKKIFNYYFKDADKILRKKLYQACKREDTYHFNACAARIIRSIILCLFAINKTYFPGDKWNNNYIRDFEYLPTGYCRKIKKVFYLGDLSKKDKEKKFKILSQIIDEIKKLYENVRKAHLDAKRMKD